MSQKSVRIVVPTYKDIACLDNWKHRIPCDFKKTIYWKNDELKEGEEIVKDDEQIEIPNIGGCDYAFLYHICKNYANLDDITIFTKIQWAADLEGDIVSRFGECVNFDYYNLAHRVIPCLQFWQDCNELHCAKKKNIRCEEVFRNTHCYKAQCAIDWYHEIFQNTPPPKSVFGLTFGPCFALSKRVIHRHPKSVYESLLNKFSPTSKSWDWEIFKQGFPTFEKAHYDVGRHYHDEIARLYPVLFTHGLDPNEYKFHFTG
jgi:hypothetical protein